MRMKPSFLAAFAAFTLLTGCKSTLNPNYEVAPTNLSSETHSYKLSNVYGDLNDVTIFNAIRSGIDDASGMRAYANKPGSNTYIRGRQVKQNGEILSVVYRNTVVTDAGSFSSYQSGDFSVKISNSGEFSDITVTTPSKLDVNTGTALFMDVEHFDSSTNVVNDLKKISNDLNFSIEGNKPFSGEEKSTFSVDAIYNSFSRSLASNMKIKARTSEVLFSFNIDKITVDAKISPYRDGSMVEYRYYLPYKLNSDGSVINTPNEMATVEKTISTKINQIVNS